MIHLKDYPIITSEQNPKVKLAKSLLHQARQRKKQGKTVLEGIHLLDALLKSKYLVPFECGPKNKLQILLAENTLENQEVQQILQQLSQNSHTQNISLTILSDTLYRNLRTLGAGVDIMAIIDIPNLKLTTSIKTDCLILNDIQDSGNLGTLLRTAAAVGVNKILCTAHTAQVWSPKTLRAGMGAQFSLTIYEGLSIEKIVNYVKTPMLATSSHVNTNIYQYDLQKPVAWVMGHEGQGVCKELMQHATSICLPQPNGQESLNVAIAGALCLYETLRQRQFS